MDVMTIELKVLALVLGLVATTGGFILWLHRLIVRFERLEQQAAHRKQDTKIILRALQACLNGLHQQGANGPVTDTLAELNEYILESR